MTKEFLQALNDCRAVKFRQQAEIPGVPTHGAQYGYKARRIIAKELEAAAGPNYRLGRGRSGRFSAPIKFKELYNAVLSTGVAQPTISLWLRKYSDLLGPATRVAVEHDGHCFISEM
jgi:hypothetical protein